jgi:DNA-binding MarR family transcriptional regulator
MLGGNYYDSGLSALEWHVLYLLACAHKSQSIGQISQQLGIAPSAASVAVSSLVKRRFAQRSQDPQDARARRVVLTAAGTQMQEKIEQLAVQRLATAISSIRREHLTTGLSVLERFVGARAVGAGVPLGAYWHMQVLDDEAARRTARALSARHYLGHNIAAALPSSFFSAEDQNYALYSRDKVVGALSLSRLTEGAADGIPVRLNCLTAPQVKVPPGILAEFLCRALLAIQAGAASSNSAAEKSDPVTLLVPPELRRLAPFQGNCSADGQRWRVHARREYEIRDSR